MATTYICDFPLYFPFFFTPERTTVDARQVASVRQLTPTRETPIP
jgi:hypothetical protein